MNPDTVVKNNSLNELCKYIKNNSDIGVVGAKIINPDGTTQLASKRSFPSLWVGISKFFGLNSLFPNSKFFGKYNRTYSDEDKILNVDAVSGSCMVFSRNVFDKLNGFDESFFLYFEDTDFCTRAKDAGFKIIYNPTSKVIHFKGESHKNAPIDIIKIFHNSMSIYFNKHKNKFKLWPLSWFLIKIGIFAHLIKSYINLNKIVLTFLISVSALTVNAQWAASVTAGSADYEIVLSETLTNPDSVYTTNLDDSFLYRDLGIDYSFGPHQVGVKIGGLANEPDAVNSTDTSNSNRIETRIFIYQLYKNLGGFC